MRTNLRVPYADKGEASYLGAKWDQAARTWYTVDDDLRRFRRWLPTGQSQIVRKPKDIHAARCTPRIDFSLPDCCCASAPWDDCEHTFEPLLVDEALAHIQSIRGPQ